MAIAQTRCLLVDDMDSSIHYARGPWFYDINATENICYFGLSLFGTLHGTNSSAIITFEFDGAKIAPQGAFRNTTEGAVFPTWTCLVDDVNYTSLPFQYPSNRWTLCEVDTLPDGQHNLTLQIQVPPGQQFWFDYMEYEPSENVPLENANIYIDSSDPDVIYGTGWSSFGGIQGEEAQILGTSLKLNFHGISVMCFGIIPGNSTANMTTLTYSVDGGSPGTANVSGSPSLTSPVLFNQYLFQTEPLSVKEHVLEIVYNGNAPQSVPLVIDNFVVLNRTSSSTSTTAMASEVVSVPASPESSSSKGNVIGASQTATPSHLQRNNGAIAGIAIGGCLALIGLAIFIFIMGRRQRRLGNGWYSGTHRYPLHEDGRD